MDEQNDIVVKLSDLQREKIRKYRETCKKESEIQARLSAAQKELNEVTVEKNAYEKEVAGYIKKDDKELDALLRKKLPMLGVTKSLINFETEIVEISFVSDVSKVSINMQMKSLIPSMTLIESPNLRLSFIKDFKVAFNLTERASLIDKLKHQEDKPAMNLKLK